MVITLLKVDITTSYYQWPEKEKSIHNEEHKKTILSYLYYSHFWRARVAQWVR